MIALYWPVLMLGTAFLIFAHTHTDELPIVLGLVLITSTVLALIFPRRVVMTGAVLGIAVFVAETLVHFTFLTAPYPPSRTIPWVALMAYVPALLGVVIGAGIRRLSAG